MPVFFIAEAGVNHDGSEARALDMVDIAADAGADAVKFQTFTAEALVTPDARKAEYQQRQTGEGSQFAMLKRLELSYDAHRRIADRCAARGIEFMSTAFDEDAADFLVELGVKRLKAPSGELTNLPFLRRLAGYGLPLIVSTGMGTLAEVEEAVATVTAARADVTVLHCTSDYPASPDDVNLRAMATIAATTGLPVGYSDHTLGLAVSTAAVALGATVIEKHFTFDRGLAGPDHAASLEPDELAALIEQIRVVERALGSATKAPTAAEMSVRDVARRSVVSRRDLAVGAVLAAGDLAVMRPGTGIAPKHADALAGRTLARSVKAGTPFAWADLA